MKTHYLDFLFHEDEAQHTGMKFEELPDELMAVSQTYAHPEYEEYQEPKIMDKPAARQIWVDLLDSGEYDTRR